MVKISLRTKYPYLTVERVKNNDLATIIETPSILAASESKFGKEQTQIIVKLKSDCKIYRWNLNNTSSDRLVNEFGEDGDSWIGDIIKIEKRAENIQGQERIVLYAQPIKAKEATA